MNISMFTYVAPTIFYPNIQFHDVSFYEKLLSSVCETKLISVIFLEGLERNVQ